MLERCPHRARPRRTLTAVRGGICDRFLFGFALLTLVRAGEALAGDAAGSSAAARAELERPVPRLSAAPLTGPLFTKQPYAVRSMSEPLFLAPGAYRLDAPPELPSFPAKDFRPRGRSVFDADPRLLGPEDNLSFNKTSWQRLNEYRTRDRVRVLTLWESGVSAISIQTDRKGDPWLQWTSSIMNRGGASHGILDQLFPTSLFGGTTHITRSPTAQPSRITGALSALHIGSAPPPP
jgi:hypothetical protein